MASPARVALPGLEEGRSVLVTGGGGAIGRAVGEAFLSLGMGVGLLGRSRSRMEDVAAAFASDLALPLQADVADADQMAVAVEEMFRRFGSIDVLVHAAAVSEGAVPLEELTDQQLEGVVRTNVIGSVVVARAVAPVMVRQRRGQIVNIASVAAYQATVGRVAYGTSKAALVHLTRQLAVELGPHGIRVNSISPGQTPNRISLVGDEPGHPPHAKVSPQGEAGVKRIPLRRRGELQDFVGPVLFLASDLASYITGVDIPVEGGTMVLR